ncbi:unnamed protein product, partial [Discosporangium mesarthrocarpum]
MYPGMCPPYLPWLGYGQLLLPKMGGYLTRKDEIHHGRLEMFLHEVGRREAMYFRSRGIEETDLAFQDPVRYKDHYYKIKLGIDPEDEKARREVAKHYMEGLYWVLKYYHCGVESAGSWSWYYPHLYAPLATEMKDLMSLEIKFDKGRPFPSLLQLLSVLPPQSASFLPEPYKKLMVEKDSPLLSYFPNDFECDSNGKRNSWETVVKIPFIDEEDMFQALSKINHEMQLSPVDRLRNVEGRVWSYRPHWQLRATENMRRRSVPIPNGPAQRRAPEEGSQSAQGQGKGKG